MHAAARQPGSYTAVSTISRIGLAGLSPYWRGPARKLRSEQFQISLVESPRYLRMRHGTGRAKKCRMRFVFSFSADDQITGDMFYASGFGYEPDVNDAGALRSRRSANLFTLSAILMLRIAHRSQQLSNARAVVALSWFSHRKEHLARTALVRGRLIRTLFELQCIEEKSSLLYGFDKRRTPIITTAHRAASSPRSTPRRRTNDGIFGQPSAVRSATLMSRSMSRSCYKMWRDANVASRRLDNISFRRCW